MQMRGGLQRKQKSNYNRNPTSSVKRCNEGTVLTTNGNRFFSFQIIHFLSLRNGLKPKRSYKNSMSTHRAVVERHTHKPSPFLLVLLVAVVLLNTWEVKDIPLWRESQPPSHLVKLNQYHNGTESLSSKSWYYLSVGHFLLKRTGEKIWNQGTEDLL